MTELLKDKINDHLSERSKDTNDALKKFLVEKVLDDSKEDNKKLKAEIMSDIDLDEKLESALNKEHLTNFLTKMKEEITSLGYTEAYKTRGKALTFGVQSALSLLGFDIGGAEIDGYYGKNTVKAVKQFQAWKGINVDGSAGQETISSLLTAGLDTKITEEEKAKLDITVTTTKTKKDNEKASKDFYDTHAAFTEKTYGTVVNKVYKVEKFSDIPAVIMKDTVIDFGNFNLFSNGLVYEYNSNGDGIVRRGNRSELDAAGTWKEVVKSDPVPTPEVVKQPVSRTEKINEDIYKIVDKNLREVLNPGNAETRNAIIALLTPEQKTWFQTHIMGKYTDSMTSFEFSQSNPRFSISMWDRAANSKRISLGSIGFEDYFKDNKLNKEGIYKSVINMIQGQVDAEKAVAAKITKEKKDKETRQSVEKILNAFRGTTYELKDLFPDKVGDMAYESYFNKFDDSKLEIRGSKYTKVSSENLTDITKATVTFDLDDDGNDEAYNVNKTTSLGNIMTNGAFDKNKAKELLKPIVKEIVEKNFTV